MSCSRRWIPARSWRPPHSDGRRRKGRSGSGMAGPSRDRKRRAVLWTHRSDGLPDRGRPRQRGGRTHHSSRPRQPIEGTFAPRGHRLHRSRHRRGLCRVVGAGLGQAGARLSWAAMLFLRSHLSPDHLKSQIFTVGAGLRTTATAAGAALAASASGLGGALTVGLIGVIWVLSAAWMTAFPRSAAGS